jgi:hypothetical protein
MTASTLGSLFQKIQGLSVEPVPFDPSAIGDEVAQRTQWGPAKGGGASFRTHRLVRVDSNRLEFKATAGALAFYWLFLVVGLGVLIGFSVGGSSRGSVVPLIVGAMFVVAGGAMLRFGTAPIVFDKRKGSYWRGRTSPYDVRHTSELTHHAPLKRVHALQIVSEYCRGNKSSYYSYELNLVLDDGSRQTVVDHGNLERLRADARTLGRFLGTPVWDATE